MTIESAGGSLTGNIFGVEIVPSAKEASGLWNIDEHRESKRTGNWPYFLYGLMLWAYPAGGASTNAWRFPFDTEVNSAVSWSPAIRAEGAFSTYRDGYMNSGFQTTGIGGSNSLVAKWTYPLNVLSAVVAPGAEREASMAVASDTHGYIAGGNASPVAATVISLDVEKYALSDETLTVLPSLDPMRRGKGFDAITQGYLVIASKGTAPSTAAGSMLQTSQIQTVDYATDTIAVSPNSLIETTGTATGFQTSTYARILYVGATSSALRFDELTFSTGVVSAGTPPTTVALLSRGAFSSPTGGYHFVRTFPTVNESFNRYTFASDTWDLLVKTISGTVEPNGVAPPVWK
jgi:hypothetical protein